VSITRKKKRFYETYQFPDPITVTLCFFEYGPRVAIFAIGGGVKWLEVWAMRLTAWVAVAAETGGMRVSIPPFLEHCRDRGSKREVKRYRT
jgi:hypothetical protein